MTRIGIVLFAALALLASGSVAAASIDWSGKRYSFYLDEEPVASVIREIAAREGMPVKVSDKVDVKVSGRFEGVTGKQIFQDLLSGYGLVHYYDGYTLHIDRVGDAVSEALELNSMTPQEFRQALADKGVYDKRFYLAGLEREGVVLVSGPTAYVKRVRDLARIIERRGRRYDVFYKWTDEAGQAHFSSDASSAPEGASSVRVPRRKRPQEFADGISVDPSGDFVSYSSE